MNRFFCLFLSTVFFLWILPLGVLIKPAQQMLFCGGQRAICLCTHLVNKSLEKTGGQVVVRAADRALSSNEVRSNGGSVFPYIFIADEALSLVEPAGADSQERSLYALSVSRPIDHVPKG